MKKYIKLINKRNGLLFKLTKDGLKELNELSLREDRTDNEKFLELLEYNLCNGEIEQIYAEEIGALTESLIFSTDYTYIDDNTNKVELFNLFWFPDYCVVSLIEKLKSDGEIFFSNGMDPIEVITIQKL